jgi:hypothetical protein
MTNFIYDNTSLAFPKSDFSPLPVGANPVQWIVAANWNQLAQAVIDLRDGIRAAKYLGFTEQASDPNPISYASSWLWVRTSDKQLVHRRSDASERAIADKSTDLFPDTDNTLQLGSNSKRWLSVTATTYTAAIVALTGGSTSQNYQTFGDGVSAPVAPASNARIRYNDSTKKLQASVDAGSYLNVVTGTPFGSAGQTIIRIIPCGDHDDNDTVNPKAVGSIAVNPADYAIAGTTLSWKFRAVAAAGNGTVTAKVTLRNITDAVDVTTVTFVGSTAATKQEVSLTVPTDLPNSEKFYEVRIFVQSHVAADDLIVLYTAELRAINTVT